MADEKETFFENYAHCASEWALEEIWEAKINNETGLSFCKHEIDDLSPLRSLINLQVLTVPETEVSDLTPLSSLVNLRVLDISETNVSDLSPLKGLVNLQSLDLWHSQVNDLSPLTALVNLQELNVLHTYVDDLSPLKELVNLQMLNVSSTHISDLSPLEGLVNLQTLSVSNTQVSDLSPLTSLVNLHSLKFFDTDVSDLSPLKALIEKGIEVRYKEGYESHHGIYCGETPLVNPPIEIAQKGNKAILRYWKEQERVGLTTINEARLLIVGQGGAGKTTLKDKLKSSTAPMPAADMTTLGVNIESIICPSKYGSDFTVKVWDFGGQEIQRYAHQFFMSDSVVYAVLSNTREQNPNFQYWLNIIELLGKDSPFFVVQNERDGHKEHLKDAVKIQERFPITFQSVEQVNLKEAASDPRFEALRLKLFAAATQLPHTQRQVLTSFSNVRRELENISQNRQTIFYSEFQNLCKEEGIEDRELMNDYARWMTELGIALHFHDDIHLKSQVFLNPKWIIDALFKLLYHPSVEHNRGHFTEADAEQIWSDSQYDNMHGILLHLMVKFRLCYETKRSEQYIVPQRLPPRSEPFVPDTDSTHLIYQYKFMPSGLLTQLCCSLHNWIEKDQIWSDAVQFVCKKGDGRVFARENSVLHQIELFAFGSQKGTLIKTVVDELDEIHAGTKLNNLKVEKLAPCPCESCEQARKRGQEPYFFDYTWLIELLQDGTTEEWCRLSRKKIPILEILRHSQIPAFKIEEIRDLISAGELDKAVNLLRSAYPDDHDCITLSGRLKQQKHDDDMDLLSYEDKKREVAKLRKAILITAERLSAL